MEFMNIGELDINLEKFFLYDLKNFFGWIVDNYGLVYVFEKGAIIKVSFENISFYKCIIGVYEGNEFVIWDGKIFINGEEMDEYIFKMNYYWVMGDNWYNFEDSWVWGFVFEDYIVGKFIIIWFFIKEGLIGNGINWSCFFKYVGNLK